MKSYTEKVRAIAGRLLSEGKVDCFIGFAEGSVPGVPRPTVIEDAAQAETLIWNNHCAMNLSTYLHGLNGKTAGVCATGCVSRNIVVHLQEKQIAREQVYVVGIPCTGMKDLRSEDGALQRNCAACTVRNPVISDEMVAEPLADPGAAKPFEAVDAVEALAPEQRWERFTEVYSNCIRCYACRQACPECYCPTCFVDESQPQWLGKSSDPNDTLTFHLLRAFHMAGRCTECGACERACPMDIPVRHLTEKIVKDAQALFGHTSGASPDDPPLLDVYKTDDPNDFVR